MFPVDSSSYEVSYKPSSLPSWAVYSVAILLTVSQSRSRLIATVASLNRDVERAVFLTPAATVDSICDLYLSLLEYEILDTEPELSEPLNKVFPVVSIIVIPLVVLLPTAVARNTAMLSAASSDTVLLVSTVTATVVSFSLNKKN